MGRIRRLTAIAGAAALAGSLVTGPAQADTPEVFQGEAQGTALDLAVLGKQVTLGSSSAKADSTGQATATGIGVLTTNVSDVNTDGLVGLKSTEKVATAADGSEDVKPKSCGKVVNLDEYVPEALSLGLACSAASATSGPAPSATAEGSVVEAGVNAATLIRKVEETTGEISDDVQAIGSTVASLLDTVCDALGGTDEGLTCDAATTVEDLVESVLKTETLDVEIGKATSSVVTTDDSVTSTATASGATIKILPLPKVDGLPSTDPVVTISVGSSKASASYDRDGGTSAGAADPAIVRVTFNTVLTDSLADQLPELPAGLDLTDIVITPSTLLDLQALLEDAPDDVSPLVESCEDGRAICILPGSALESKIWLATSKVTTNPDGSVVAVADAVRMDLVTGIDFSDLAGVNVNDTADLDLSTPGVRLALAGVVAGVGGAPAQTTVTVPPVTELKRSGGPLPPLELPRTGGFPLVPVLGAGALSLAAFLRRASAKASR